MAIIVNPISDDAVKEACDRFESNNFSGLALIGEGCNAMVYRLNGCAFKVYRSGVQTLYECHEAKYLEIAQGHPSILTLYAYKTGKFMLRQYAQGIEFTIKRLSRSDIALRPDWKEHLTASFAWLIEKGLYLSDLAGFNFVINSDGLPMIVDFGAFGRKKDHEQPEEIIQRLEGIYHSALKIRHCSQEKDSA